MSAFPTRKSQDAFLAYYKTLKDDDEDKGEDLFNDEESGEESEPDEELDEILDRGAVDDDEARHKQLDAAHRAAEEKQLQAIASRFEARAAAYDDESAEESVFSQQAKQAKAAGRRARAEAEAARQAEDEAEKERVEGLKKRKHDALVALFAAYESEGVSDVTTASTLTHAPPQPEAKNTEAAGCKKPRFRIAKKAKD